MYRSSGYTILSLQFSCISTSRLYIVEYDMPVFAAMARAGMPALRMMHPSHTTRSSDPSGALSRSACIEAEVTDLMNLLPAGSLPFPGLPRRL